MTALSVNLNKVALLRNSREGDQPSVLDAAKTVIAAGAAGITVHPRSDQRHIRPSDVTELAQLLQDYPSVEFNIEGNPAAGPRDNGYPGLDVLIEAARPQQATLVPDSDTQLTSDHGWDLERRDHFEAPPGLFLGLGPAFAAGREVEGLAIDDLAPLSLHLLGLPLAADMPGTARGAWSKALDPALPAPDPVIIPTYEGLGDEAQNNDDSPVLDENLRKESAGE